MCGATRFQTYPSPAPGQLPTDDAAGDRAEPDLGEDDSNGFRTPHILVDNILYCVILHYNCYIRIYIYI